MADIKVTSNIVYLDRKRRADEAGPEYQQGLPDPPLLKDADLEQRSVRAGFAIDGGCISIEVQPGETLGAFKVALQFEGPLGETVSTDAAVIEKVRSTSLQTQNDLLDDAADWLRDLLQSFEGSFDVAIQSQPCPNATKRFEPLRAADRLRGLEQQPVVDRKVGAQHLVPVVVERKR